MDRTVADEYKSSLNDLNFNSKPHISMLTMLADENKKHAPLIVNTIINHINSVPPEIKLPGLYLVDSIIKNIGAQYLKIFCQHIISLFTSVFEKVDENTRSLMFRLRQTWTDILPNKTLYNMDVSVQKLDPAWPVTAKNPSKRILINPKFLDTPVKEMKESDAYTTSLKTEESKIKQKQGEVLQELLAKQEQLRQLELKKLQLTMKKKSGAVGPSSSLLPFKQNPIRDPRMVKINNVSKNPSASNASLNSLSQGKLTTPLVSCISSQDKSTSISKSVAQSNAENSRNNINDTNSEEKSHIANEPSKQQKNVSIKHKNDKCVKNKLSPISKNKANEDVKSNFNETEITSVKTNKKCKDVPKDSTNILKKKEIVSDNRKIPHLSASTSVDASKKKVPFKKIPKKNEKIKLSPNLGNTDKVSLKVKNEPTNATNTVNFKMKKNSTKFIEPINEENSVHKKNDSIKSDSVRNRVETIQSDVKSIAQKDEDLRTNSLPLMDGDAFKRKPKREIIASDPSTVESDKIHPPSKRIKSEDIENCNPDCRTDSPVLFGNEDQDLRKSENSSINDVKSKDWSQYKASHPDEYRPCPIRQECSFDKFRAQKHQFSSSKQYYQNKHERFGSSRYSRGRYFPRRSTQRWHFPRGNRGHAFYNYPTNAFVFDSHAFLQQAEEKYRSGRISETEYMDLRRDLQKIVECKEYQSFADRFPNVQNIDHYGRNPESQYFREKFERKKNFLREDLTIQGPSINLPAIKPFVLDGKERLVHYIDDKAFVLIDNKEPRELTFKDEERKVFIEGLVEPLMLGFDGKSVEFKINGIRHILRFGTPGRELYINNHPYEVQFGGPPIIVRLENGQVHKIRLSGPPPQVIVGNTPQYDLFAKHSNTDGSAFLQEASQTSKDTNSENPASSLLDVDMRINPENVQQSNVLLSEDSPFYSNDMKDVDWRHIPPSSNPKTDKNLSRVKMENDTSSNFDSWSEEDSHNKAEFLKDRHNQSENPVPKETSSYNWETSMQDHHVSDHISNNPPSNSEENWHYKQHKNSWRYNDYHQNNPMPHLEEYQVFQKSSDTTQHLKKNKSFSHFNTNYSHPKFLKRPPFQNKNPREQDDQLNYGDSSDTHREPLNQLQAKFSAAPLKALLPSPLFPQECPIDSSVVSQSIGFPSVPASSASEVKPPASSSSVLNVDVESLLEKLVAAGIINNKQYEQPTVENLEIAVPEIADTSENDPPSETIPDIELSAENLKVHHVGVATALHKGLQCATCGMRFKDMQNDQYSRHLDWHFRMNRRDKDGAKKAISRRWYYELEDWVQFEEFEDFEERVPSYFELQADNKISEIIEVPTVISVPATSDDEESCPVCSEKFQLFWVEEEEEWHFRDAVRHNNVTYHPACYEDFKKTLEADKTLKNEESNSGGLLEIEEDIYMLLNSLLDSVIETIETISENDSNIENNSMDIDQESPSREVHSEEEFLEGKPGEEEIIGLISESDVEMDIDIPATDSKMVVMQSGGITLKVKAESLQCHSPSNPSEKDSKQGNDKPIDDDEIDFRPPTPDPNFEVRPLVSRGRELSGLCSVM